MRTSLLSGKVEILFVNNQRYEALFFGDGVISKMSLGASSPISATEALSELLEMIKLHYKSVDLMTPYRDNE